MSDRRVQSSTGPAYAEVAHGDQCVALMLIDADGAFAGGLVLDPPGARRLAELLVEQAQSSEEGR